MKFSLWSTLITISTLSLSSCLINESESYTKKIDYESIHGNIKSVLVTNHVAVERFGEFQKERISYQKKTFYNENGNKVRYKYLSGNKIRYNTDAPWNEHLYFYDDLGNLIKEVWGKNVFYFKNDISGNRIEENYFEPEGKLKWRCYYKYDSNRNKIEQIFYDSNGKLNLNKYYKYDALGNKINECIINRDGFLTENYIWDYDRYGNLLEKKSIKRKGEWFNNFNINKSKYQVDGEFYYKVIYNYFENINTIQMLTYNDDGSLREVENKKYSNFDKFGNWLTYTISNSETEDKIIVEREIKYYSTTNKTSQ